MCYPYPNDVIMIIVLCCLLWPPTCLSLQSNSIYYQWRLLRTDHFPSNLLTRFHTWKYTSESCKLMLLLKYFKWWDGQPWKNYLLPTTTLFIFLICYRILRIEIIIHSNYESMLKSGSNYFSSNNYQVYAQKIMLCHSLPLLYILCIYQLNMPIL